MKKINFVINETDQINGYTNLGIDKAQTLINGTCEEIICSVLDQCLYEDRLALIATLSKKLSNLGLLTLKFINGTRICKDVAKGNINSKFLSSIMNQSKSIFLEPDIMEIISQLNGLVLYKTFNDNSHITIILQKRL